MKIGLSFFQRNSGGDLGLISYHPPSSPTWYWAIGITKRQTDLRRWFSRSPYRNGQWHDYYWIWKGRYLVVSRQSYHRQKAVVL